MSIVPESVSLSACGNVRKVNQDAVFVLETEALSVYLVADGMGGHSDGELASRGVVSAMEAWASAWTPPEEAAWQQMLTEVTEVLQAENDRIFRDCNADGKICGTTLVLIIVMQGMYALFSIGDSRLYRLEKRHVLQLTTDDVWENDPAQTAGLSEQQIRTHPNRGKLLRAFGTAQDLRLHRQTGPLAKDMLFLICSDGIYKYCDEKTLSRACRKAKKGGKPMTEALRLLEQKVLDGGARDNYSAVFVRT